MRFGLGYYLESTYKQKSRPVRCKNGVYADSATGRKLNPEEAAEGKVVFLEGSKQYVNQKLMEPVYVDYTW